MNKIIKSGLELFRSRTTALEHITEFEDYYGYSIPPVYKIFMEQLNIGRNSLKREEVFIEQENEKFEIADLVYFGKYSNYIGLYYLLSLKESISAMTNAYSPNDAIHKMGFAMIGSCIDNMSLLLGLNKENRDKVYLEDTFTFPNGERILLVSDNIFDFVRGLSLVEFNNVGFGMNNYSSLYKNWGEDFWRVKKDEMEFGAE